MRRGRSSRAAVLLIAAALLLCAPVDVTPGGAEAPLDKYRSLLEEKLALERENRSLQKEVELARSKSPYIMFDVHSGILSFRVRGKSFKEYQVKAISSRGWGRRPIAPEALWRRHEGPLTIAEKEGGRQEIVPPSEDGAEAPHGGHDPGAEPDDATILGVKAPADYYIKFEEAVVFQVQSERRLSLREKAVQRAGEFAAAVRDLWRTEDPDEPLILYLLMDTETARHLYHSILPGERIYISPPPPSVTVIARK